MFAFDAFLESHQLNRCTGWGGPSVSLSAVFFFKGLEKDLKILSSLTEKQGEKINACPMLQYRLLLLFSVGSLENTNHCA